MCIFHIFSKVCVIPVHFSTSQRDADCIAAVWSCRFFFKSSSAQFPFAILPTVDFHDGGHEFCHFPLPIIFTMINGHT